MKRITFPFFIILRYELDDIGDQVYNNLLHSTVRTDHMYVSINGAMNENGELAVLNMKEDYGKVQQRSQFCLPTKTVVFGKEIK